MQTAVALRDWIVSADYEGFVEVNGFNINGVYQKLQFIERFLKGRMLGPQSYCDCLFSCQAFRQKMSPHGEYWDGFYCGENNFGKYTMRLIDFLVDHLGEWDLIACNGNAAERAWSWSGLVSMVAREQQLVFRHRPKAGRVFMATAQHTPLGRPPMQAPEYWTTESREGTEAFKVVPATEEEKEWLQQLLDGSYVKKATRDRRGGRLAKRFELVAAVRSENPDLWDAFANRRHKAAVGTFREFIFFHEESIYQEYALFYRRVHGGETSETVLEEVDCTGPAPAVLADDVELKLSNYGVPLAYKSAYKK
eukprot:s2835_g13.t1